VYLPDDPQRLTSQPGSLADLVTGCLEALHTDALIALMRSATRVLQPGGYLRCVVLHPGRLDLTASPWLSPHRTSTRHRHRHANRDRILSCGGKPLTSWQAHLAPVLDWARTSGLVLDTWIQVQQSPSTRDDRSEPIEQASALLLGGHRAMTSQEGNQWAIA
jgi:hypothetical protein